MGGLTGLWAFILLLAIPALTADDVELEPETWLVGGLLVSPFAVTAVVAGALLGLATTWLLTRTFPEKYVNHVVVRLGNRVRRWILAAIAAMAAAIVVLFVFTVIVYIKADAREPDLGSHSVPPRCSPVPSLSLDDLSREPTCNLAGAIVEITPSSHLTVPDANVNGTAYSENRSKYGIANFGNELGVVVYTSDRQWGTPKGARAVREQGWTP